MLASVGVIALALGGAGLGLAWPRLPLPTGPSPIGTVRLELAAPPNGHRLVLYLWYPAVVTPGLRRAGYRDGAGLLSRQRLVATHAWRDAPVAPGRHAVVFYAHGWGGYAQENTALLEELASHGFVAAALGAPGGFGTWRSPGGKTLNLDGPFDFSTEEAADATVAIGTHNVRTRAADLERALEALSALDAHDPTGRFAGHLRIDRVGALGFSFGGAVAAEASRLDRRIAAVMNLDGWLFGPVQHEGVAVPYIVFSDSSPLPAPEDLHSREPARRDFALLMGRDWDLMRRNFVRHGGDYLTVGGAVHADFSDQSLLSWRPRRPGRIAPARASAIVRACSVAFFGRWLRGDPAGVLAGTGAPFEEVRRESWAVPPRARDSAAVAASEMRAN